MNFYAGIIQTGGKQDFLSIHVNMMLSNDGETKGG